MLIKGVTLFLYFWLLNFLVHNDLNLVFRAGTYTVEGLSVLGGMLAVTLTGWAITHYLNLVPRVKIAVNFLLGGFNFFSLGFLILGLRQWFTLRDTLYIRPWAEIRILYSEAIHQRIWWETYTTSLGKVNPPTEVIPVLGESLSMTAELARIAAQDYIVLISKKVTPPPVQNNDYNLLYIAAGVLLGVIIVGGLFLYFSRPPGSPPSSPPGGPPSPETPPWWTKPEAAEVKPVVSSPKWKPEDYDELIALVSGRVATNAPSSSPSSPPEGEFGLDEVISYFESLPPAPVRPRSPCKFTIEDVEALFERAPRAARAAPGTTTADVLAAPRPRGVEGLITRASAVRGPRPAPPVRTPREAAELYLDQNYSSVSSTPLTGAARAELVSAMASAVTGMAEYAAELHGGRTIVNPPTEEVPPRRSRPAGVFTPLSAFPDLPPPPPRRTRAEELYGPDSGIWDYVAEIEANSRRNFPPAGDSGKTPK